MGAFAVAPVRHPSAEHSGVSGSRATLFCLDSHLLQVPGGFTRPWLTAPRLWHPVPRASQAGVTSSRSPADQPPVCFATRGWRVPDTVT